jgi:hypothetical protein
MTLRPLTVLATLGMLATLGATTAPATGPTTAPATRPAPRAAHYLTLRYPLPNGDRNGVVEFYNECVVRQEVTGSYFCAAGFAGGYFGIQDRPDKKVGIFSVWDVANRKIMDPTLVGEPQQTHPVFIGPGVRATRFGNEGTGGHSDFDMDWKVGNTYQFDLRATINGKRTEYQGWFRDPASNDGWRHIATFSAPDGGKRLTGLYSFLEDFRRDGRSAHQIRRGEYGNGWVKVTPDGPWLPLMKARLAENKYPTQPIDDLDAGIVGNRFFLQNGIGTHQTVKIGDLFTLPDGALTVPPVGPPSPAPSTRAE